VFIELVADGDGAADVGLDGGNVIGRRWDVDTENLLEEPDSADDRRGGGAIGGDF